MTSLTLASIEQECTLLIGDPTYATFTQLQIVDWINQAIRDLSIHFPRMADYTVSTTLGDHLYELETYIKGVVSVEYPTAQTPPRFLMRKAYTDPKFWLLEGYYDFVKPQTSTSAVPPLLYISDHTPAGQTITVKCLTDHAPLFDSSDECTVLERHLHLIGLFVRWKAISERSTHESMDPALWPCVPPSWKTPPRKPKPPTKTPLPALSPPNPTPPKSPGIWMITTGFIDLTK